MKISLKSFALAFVSNIVPIVTGVVRIVMGDVVLGAGAVAGGIGATIIQAINAESEARIMRSPIRVKWFFSRPYVWLTVIAGLYVSTLIILHQFYE